MNDPDWLLLVTNLPGRNQALRMRVWRALKAAGAGLLRDGVYLLPRSEAAQDVLEEQAADIRTGGGSAQVLPLARAGAQQAEFQALFDRTPDHARIQKRIETFRRSLRKSTELRARRELASLKRDVASLIAIDFFPRGGPDQLARLLASAEEALTAKYSPHEPQPVQDKIIAKSRRDYQGRRWATRRRLWVDRICSAWLIKRFIDPKATFVWLASPADLPRGAVGFDFDGAEFTHVGARVTFQVLLANFGLEKHDALVHIGQLVHCLDVDGPPVPEAAGFATLLTGARANAADDDALTRAIFPLLDLLQAGCAEQSKEEKAGR